MLLAERQCWCARKFHGGTLWSVRVIKKTYYGNKRLVSTKGNSVKSNESVMNYSMPCYTLYQSWSHNHTQWWAVRLYLTRLTLCLVIRLTCISVTAGAATSLHQITEEVERRSICCLQHHSMGVLYHEITVWIRNNIQFFVECNYS